jgi:triacylglycerol lipase
MSTRRKTISTEQEFTELRSRALQAKGKLARIRRIPSCGLLEHVASRILMGPQRPHNVIVEDPGSAAWDAGKAELLAKAAQLAYQDDCTFERIPKKLRRQAGFGLHHGGFRKLFSKVPGVETQAYVAADDRMVLLLFRGTKPLSLLDWVLDFEVDTTAVDLPLAHGSKVHVHHGFWKGVDAIWPELESALRTFLLAAPGAPRPLYIGGHSLGGALAIVAASRLPDDLRACLKGVYTIGQPRVGHKDFADAYQNALGTITWRLINGNDLVPRVPFEHVMHYAHAGTEVPCDVGPDVMLHLPWCNPAWKIAHNFVYDLLPDDIHDHFPEAYVLAARQMNDR